MKLIQEMMAAHQLVGGIVYDAVMRGDWSVVSQFKPEHCAPLFAVPERIVAYHYVRRGTLIVVVPDCPPVCAEAGTMVLFPRNDPHIICSSPALDPTPGDQVFTAGGHAGPNLVRIEGEGPECALFCGWLGVDNCAQSLIAALPRVLVARSDGDARGAFLSSSLRYAAEELSGNPAMVARLSQLFFEESVNRYIDDLPADQAVELRALRDPAMARALALIRDLTRHDLNLDRLAREAGLSRTVLTGRFVDLFGEPPIRYRSRLRLREAARMLSEGSSIADAAETSGFGSEASFSRAFKRAFGEPPASWRRRLSRIEGASV